MRISSWYQEHLMQANSVFDLISSTYRALMQEIDSRPDVNFLALQNAVDDNTLKILDDFENMLIVRLQHTLSTDDIEFASIYEVIQLLRDDIDAISDKGNVKDFSYLSFFLYRILSACDCYWQQAESSEKMAISGSFNINCSTTHCYVYAKEPATSFRSPLYEKKDLRLRPEDIRIATSFHQFFIFDSMSDCSITPPQILRFPGIEATTKLRVACVPMLDQMYLEFEEVQTGKLFKEYPPKGLSGNFYVKIQEQYEEICRERAVNALSKAISDGANIVVFPEYAIDFECLLRMRQYVCTHHDMIAETKFLMVVAGSRYEINGTLANNTLSVISREGDLQDSIYYKKSPYCEYRHDLQWPQQHMPKKETPPANMIINSEWLTDPGKKVCLVDIGGIGRVLPSICKDAVTDYTQKLSRLFQPSFVIDAAWSKSTGFFEEAFRNMANMQHITSILCNSCYPCKGGNAPDMLCATWYDGRMSAKVASYACPKVEEAEAKIVKCNTDEKDGTVQIDSFSQSVKASKDLCGECILWMELSIVDNNGDHSVAGGISIDNQ